MFVCRCSVCMWTWLCGCVVVCVWGCVGGASVYMCVLGDAEVCMRVDVAIDAY